MTNKESNVTQAGRRRLVICCLLISSRFAAMAAAQDSTGLSGAVFQLQLSAQAAAQGVAPQENPPLTLQQALTLARTNSQQLRSAQIAAQLATEDRVQARAALLPGVNGFLQHIYTEPNGTPSGVFVANDGPHVYNAQAVAHGDLFAPTKWADYRSAAAAEAVARAKADVTTRGLVATIVQDFYTLVAASHKLASAQQSLAEAKQFLDITQRQENAGEVAHADVVKAQIQVEQRLRDAQDAELNALKSRLGLSVLIFPDFRENFNVTDDLQDVAPLLPLESFKSLAVESSPDIKAAEASVQQQSSGVAGARSALLPSVSFDYFYGINANHFATFNPEGNRLLGSSAQVQMTIPIWNWGATQSKLRQAQLKVQQAKADLSFTQRQLQANVITFYREAEMARLQVTSLRASLDLATESLRLTSMRYQAGEATVLEVVDAQTTLLQARTAYDDGLVRYRVSLASLQTLTGTL
jgi:outer membrane protein